MSVYNGERHLREAVESILNQTFCDFEFIIVDDASTDSTPEILREYAKQDERIRLLRNAYNLGITRSLNRGLKLVHGEYIAHLDADDISLPSRLKLQTRFLDAHPQVGALGAAVEVIDEQSKTLSEEPVSTEHEALQALLLVDNCLCHSTLMARRALVQALGGYDERLRYAQDYNLWWGLSCLARLAALPEVLVQLRVVGKSISKLHRQEQLKDALKISLKAVRESLKSRFLHEEAYERFWWAYHGQYNQLKRGDIRCLQPVWELLASRMRWRQVWRPRLLVLAYHLLSHQQATEGLQLISIVMQRFGQPVEWSPMLKSFVKRQSGVMRSLSIKRPPGTKERRFWLHAAADSICRRENFSSHASHSLPYLRFQHGMSSALMIIAVPEFTNLS